jgi:hypothetical protein
MRALHFSTANLLVAVTLIGVGLALLVADSPVAAGLQTLLTLGVLLTAVIAAIYNRGEAQAFWLGMAVFGIAYYVVVLGSGLPAARAEIDVPLHAFHRIFWEPKIQSWQKAFGATLHCNIAVLFALAGGIVSRGVYLSSQNRLPGGGKR